MNAENVLSGDPAGKRAQETGVVVPFCDTITSLVTWEMSPRTECCGYYTISEDRGFPGLLPPHQSHLFLRPAYILRCRLLCDREGA